MSELAWPLVGHEAAEVSFLAALASEKLHHAWLIEGPSGIGKSILARRLAAALLGAEQQAAGRADVLVSDPVAAKLQAGAHPDFRYLTREPDEKGKLPLFIRVDEVRDSLVNFLALRPALGGRRVCIVDALDDLNLNGANALLKTLEEPPANCVLLLLYHGDRPLLPTIRSRCRRLRLSPLSGADLKTAISLSGKEVQSVALELAHGRPGEALRLSEPDAIKAASLTQRALKGLSRRESAAAGELLLSIGTSTAAFDGFRAALLDWAARTAEQSPEGGEAWLWIVRELERARVDSMDATQTVAGLISGLQERLQSA